MRQLHPEEHSQVNLSDPVAESSVLCGIIRHGFDVYSDISDLISVGTFTLDWNKAIYRCIEHALQQDDNAVLDITLIYSAAKSLGLDTYLSKKEPATHLASLMRLPIDKSNVVKLAGKIFKLQATRDIRVKLLTANSLLSDVTGDEDLHDIIAIAETPIFEFTNELTDVAGDKPQGMGDGIEEFVEHIIDNPSASLGLSSGFPKWDYAIGGGLRRGGVHMIGARKKSGKTVLCDTIALHVAKQGIPVLNVDTEVKIDIHRRRILSMFSGVPLTEIQVGEFAKSQDKINRVRQAGRDIAGLPYKHVWVGGLHWKNCESIIRRWLLKDVGFDENGKIRDCLITYDYIQIMDASHMGKLQEYQALRFLTKAIKDFATKYEVPILTFCQLNRDGITKDTTDIVAGSDGILDPIDDFSIYKTKTEDQIAQDGFQEGTRLLKPLISRNGGGFEDEKDYISMKLDKKTLRITEGRLASEIQLNKNRGEPEEFAVSDEEKLAF